MLESNATTLIRLKHLRFGHECPDGAVNIRKPTRADGERLAPSIKEEGLLQALGVWPVPGSAADGPFYTLVGGRRLMGLQVLKESGHVDDETPISAVIIEAPDAASALAKSLAAEDAHVPPHPVDRFEAFTALLDRGLSTDEIAQRFFVDKKIVRQALALGQLAAEIRSSWRTGEIDGDIAQLFTLAENPKQQVKVFEKLKKRPGGLEHLDTATVRKQFTGSEAEAARLLKFVGRIAYVDAGGAISEDLFSDGDVVVHDFNKLKRLADEKLERECDKLTKGEGWSFAEPQLKTSYMMSTHMSVKPEFTADDKKRLREIDQRQKQIHAIDPDSIDVDTDLKLEEEQLGDEKQRIEAAARARAFTDAQKKKGGCIVRIGQDGETQIDYGVTKPKEQTSPSSTGGKAAAPKEDDVAWDTRTKVLYWRELAAGEALVRDQKLTLATFLATHQFEHGPISHTYDRIDTEFLPKAKSIEQAISNLRKLPESTLVEYVVQLIANMVSLDDEGDDDGFLELLDQAVLTKAMARRFDAKTYFAGCSKPYMLGVIDEVLGAAAEHDTKSKTDLAALCAKDVTAAGWLPPELRTPSYKPPAPAKPAAAAKPAGKPKPAKKPAKIAAAKKKGAAKRKSK